MNQLTVFTWGYWGWGNHTRELVRAVDAVETARGMQPPIFVDIRFSRGVRAVGFRGAAFEQTVGKSRYRWLRKLGNANIGSGSKGVRIADASGAEDLLDLIVDADHTNRRVIFFCACEEPCGCHRATAARLLVKAAVRKELPLTVVEWPGGEPEACELLVTDRVIKSVLRQGNRIPLGDVDTERLARFAALPWGTRIRLRSNDAELAVVSGPAKLGHGWYLPVMGPEFSKEVDTIERLKTQALQLRQSLGYGALRTADRKSRGSRGRRGAA